MSGDAVFIIVSMVLIIAYTWYMMSTMIKRNRLLRELTQLIKDAEARAANEESVATEQPGHPEPPELRVVGRGAAEDGRRTP
ncbi:MAG: hypothetical protein ACRD3J_19725 [Thermoanaerobaculia bacterium]